MFCNLIERLLSQNITSDFQTRLRIYYLNIKAAPPAAIGHWLDQQTAGSAGPTPRRAVLTADTVLQKKLIRTIGSNFWECQCS